MHMHRFSGGLSLDLFRAQTFLMVIHFTSLIHKRQYIVNIFSILQVEFNILYTYKMDQLLVFALATAVTFDKTFHRGYISHTQSPRLTLQPNPKNKQSIIHILGMLSSLFTTLDINKQADSLEGASSPRPTASQNTQNPVSSAIKMEEIQIECELFLNRSVRNQPLFINPLSLSFSFYFLGCCCASASLHIDPNHPEQVARWLRGSPGRKALPFASACVWFFVCVHDLSACVHWLTPSSPFPSLQAVCGVFDKSVRTLLHDFGPMVAQLSGMLGQIYIAFPQASALDLARQVRPLRSGP